MGRDQGHIVITGASSGIGESTARAFATAGNRLTIVARRVDRLEALARELEVPVHVAPADLADLDAAVGWLDGAVAAHGPIDVAVLNAGVQYVEPALGVDDARAEALLAVNLLAPLRIGRRVARAMVERGQGTIVVVSSVAALVNTPGMAHYNASKAGVAAWFETLRDELRGSGVRILTVYPGPVKTAMEQAARARIGPNPQADRMPTGTPDELAGRIRRAVARGGERIVYPRIYGALRYARVTSQWVTSRLAPKVR